MLAIFLVLKLVAGYVDFGSATLPCNVIPMSVIPQHHQLPDDLHIQYAPYSSRILAIAPSVKLGTNGTFLTSWSLHTRATKRAEHPGLRKRGPFSGIPVPTCQPCSGNGDPIKSSNGATCTPANNKVCHNSSYDGSAKTIRDHFEMLDLVYRTLHHIIAFKETMEEHYNLSKGQVISCLAVHNVNHQTVLTQS